MYEDEFPLRLAQLRQQKGVSARDMSLSIGQNAGYKTLLSRYSYVPSPHYPSDPVSGPQQAGFSWSLLR